MNLAIRPETLLPSRRDLMDRALEPHILLGMPHLTPFGLSETWLMKELGHRHWLLLARAMNMNDADFRTADGAEAYAAICATRITAANLGHAKANDVLTVHSSLQPISRARALSRHLVSANGHSICTVELMSTFVTRMTADSNHSVARVQLPVSLQPGQASDSELAHRFATLRAAPALAPKRTALRTFRFQSTISQEFNGAGLFYFAEFQSVIARAFESWHLDPGPLATREIFFFGNIERGEMLGVDLVDIHSETGSAECRILRDDGTMIARAFITCHTDRIKQRSGSSACRQPD